MVRGVCNGSAHTLILSVASPDGTGDRLPFGGFCLSARRIRMLARWRRGGTFTQATEPHLRKSRSALAPTSSTRLSCSRLGCNEESSGSCPILAIVTPQIATMVYTELSSVTLSTGEAVQATLIEGPDNEWAERLLPALTHKGEPYVPSHLHFISSDHIGLSIVDLHREPTFVAWTGSVECLRKVLFRFVG